MPSVKRPPGKWQWKRASANVKTDYTGPHPLFDNKQFVHIFCIKRAMTDMLLSICGNSHKFFTSTVDATNKQTNNLS